MTNERNPVTHYNDPTQYNPQRPQPSLPDPFRPPAPKKPRRWVPWAIGGGAFLLGLMVGAAPSGSDTSSEPQPTVTKTVPGPAGATVPGPTVTKTVPGPARTVTAPPPAPKAAITDDGTYLVGTDIKPGTYRSGPNPDCYWARLANTSGDMDAILANNNGGNQVVTIKSSDKAFETARCGTWTRVQ